MLCLFALALLPPVLQYQLPSLLLVCGLFVLFFLFAVVVSVEPKQKQGRGYIDHKLVQTPRNFIAGRPKTDLLFWFFGDFRCDALLFMVILVIFKHKNR